MPSWGPLWPWTCTPSSSSEQNHSSFRAGPHNPWDLMPDDLRGSCCNNNGVRNTVMPLNHPETIAPSSMEEFSSTKPALGAKKVGNWCFRVLVWKLSLISVTWKIQFPAYGKASASQTLFSFPFIKTHPFTHAPSRDILIALANCFPPLLAVFGVDFGFCFSNKCIQMIKRWTRLPQV